jgi:hypothetical protein
MRIRMISPALRESREIRLFKEVGSNVRTVIEEVKEDMAEAARGDAIKMAMAPVAGAVRLLLKGPTNIWLGIVDKKAAKHTGFETGHTIKETGKELATLHPLRAAVHGINIIDSAILDAIRGIGGFQGSTRARVKGALERQAEREPSYSLAA